MYTPTEWENGDTITAEKMNNIESGISNSATGKIAIVNLSASGFGSSSHNFGYIFYATWDGEQWHPITDDENEWYQLFGFAEPPYYFLPPLIIPEGGAMYPFFCNRDDLNINVTGDISVSPENVYFNYGSVRTKCYRITGSGTITFIA